MNISVSAVTSVYNQQATIAQTIESVLAVSEELEEYIILDDGSNDGTGDIVRSYAAKYPIIRLLANETNMGTVHSFRRIFAEARGNYVLGIAGDDYLIPEAMKNLIIFAKSNPGYGLYFGNIHIEYPDRNDYRILADLKFSPTGCCWTSGEVGRAIRGKAIPSAGMLIGKQYIADPAIYRDDLKWLADWIGNLIIAIRYGAGYFPAATVVWRVYGGNYSAQSRKWPLQKELLTKMLEVLRSPDYRDVYRQMVRYRLFQSLSWDMPHLLLVRPALWDRYTAGIIAAGTARRLYELLSRLIPRKLKDILKKLCGR